MRPRDQDIVTRFKSGQTLREISAAIGITYQAVHLRLQRMGIHRQEGGISLRAAIKSKERITKRDQLALRTFGVSSHEKQELEKKYPRCLHKYRQQRNNAIQRGVEWQLNIAEWIKVWEESGHFHERAKNGYVMARYGDSGPYAAGNVYICTSSQNVKDYYKHSGRPVRRIEWNGESKTISEWANAYGINSIALRSRLDMGWSLEKSLTTKVRAYKTNS